MVWKKSSCCVHRHFVYKGCPASVHVEPESDLRERPPVHFDLLPIQLTPPHNWGGFFLAQNLVTLGEDTAPYGVVCTPLSPRVEAGGHRRPEGRVCDICWILIRPLVWRTPPRPHTGLLVADTCQRWMLSGRNAFRGEASNRAGAPRLARSVLPLALSAAPTHPETGASSTTTTPCRRRDGQPFAAPPGPPRAKGGRQGWRRPCSGDGGCGWGRMLTTRPGRLPGLLHPLQEEPARRSFLWCFRLGRQVFRPKFLNFLLNLAS